MPDRVTSPPADFPHRRAPAKNWAVLWALSLAGALLVLGSAEAFWRSRGHRPSVVDGPEVWAYHRTRVYEGGARHIVILGWSRAQLGFSTDTLRERLPGYQVTQLALPGMAPIAALRDLADDEKFRGIVICEITEKGFARSAWNDQQEYVDYYRKTFRPWHAIEIVPELLLQERIVTINPELRITELLRNAATARGFPQPSYLVTRPDRSRLADYTLTDKDDELRRQFDEGDDSRDSTNEREINELLHDYIELDAMVARIQSRGGDVVFVRMPAGLRTTPIDRQFWDAMAARTQAHTIHFRDVPAMRQLPTPDGSHLDHRDAPAFTHALIDELIRADVVKPPL